MAAHLNVLSAVARHMLRANLEAGHAVVTRHIHHRVPLSQLHPHYATSARGIGLRFMIGVTLTLTQTRVVSIMLRRPFEAGHVVVTRHVHHRVPLSQLRPHHVTSAREHVSLRLRNKPLKLSILWYPRHILQLSVENLKFSVSSRHVSTEAPDITASL